MNEKNISDVNFTQQNNILITKLNPAVNRSKLVRRNRLINLLRNGKNRKLTLIVAPAGSGKTTLLNDWLISTTKIGGHVAWVSLDQGDNEPLRFWSYFLKALLTAIPDELQDILNSEVPLNRDTFGRIINRIAEKRTHFSLVLDDFHIINENEILEDLSFWIANMPDTMHLVISGRTIPKLPISQYRAKNQLIEIGTKDLMFNFPESAIFFREVMTIEVETEDLSTLLQLTEGWIAGLQLAALSMKNHPNVKQFIADFNGNQRHISDYLTEIVLNQLEEPLQEFLIKTSILEELSAPLCDYLLGINNSQRKLEIFERSNTFITPLDEMREWYCFHPLFSDLLRTRLKRTDPQLIRELHKKACVWYLSNGYQEKVIPHALAAGDLDLAVNIIEAISQRALIEGNMIGVIQWVNSLPEECIINNPKLGLYAAEANYLLGRLDKVELSLQQVKNSMAITRKNRNLSEVDKQINQHYEMIKIAVECIQEDCSEGILLGLEALNELPKSIPTFGMMNHYLGYAFDAAGDLNSAIRVFGQAGHFALHHHIPNKYVLSQCELARMLKAQGRLVKAKDEFEGVLEFVRHMNLDTDFHYLASAGLADIYCEWNDIETSRNYSKEIISFFSSIDFKDINWLFPVVVCTSLTRCLLYYGEIEKAADFFNRCLQTLNNYINLPHRFSEIVDAQVKIWLYQGNSESANRWLRQKATIFEKNGNLTVTDKIAMAKIYLSMEKPEHANSLLEIVENQVRESGRGSHLVEVLILIAITNRMLGQKSKAIEELNKALVLGEPEGFVRIFVEHGNQIRPMLLELKVLRQKSIHRFDRMPGENYLCEIISTIDKKHIQIQHDGFQPVQESVVTSMYIDHLTDRELDVLKLLYEGNSTNDLSKKLVISVNTAKVHLRNIYQKLDVNNRKDAIERAIELNILSNG